MVETLLALILILISANLILTIKLQFRNPRSKIQNPNGVLLDTCALIDGRILELAKTGFMPVQLIVPQFVIAELQGLADGRDHLKRERARQGLDMIKELQKNPNVNVAITNDPISSQTEVDDKLVKLALKTNAALYTTDYNLSKVAEIEGVTVLNVNELAKLLRVKYLPGESAEIQIVQKGSNASQGVGYLEDGTMVVVEKAGKSIGQTVEVVFDRHLQTSAGKMMFASYKNKQ